MLLQNLLLNYLVALIFTGCLLVIGISNPIHAILILMGVFIGGTVLLMILNLPYFGLLFMIVYVGAIVVLFLFIIMMLDIKMINVTTRFRDIFAYRNFIIPFLLIEALILLIDAYTENIWIYFKNFDLYLIYLDEINRHVDYSKTLQESDPLRAIGIIIYTEAKTGFILAALLLLLAMIAAILLTMEHFKIKKIKEQDANTQALRNPTYSLRYIR